ncbi:ABC-2 type transport system permease protein [Paenibacillus sp. DS2015]|uniref:ABC transporter permease n=1 Tax=Paenibacillus sp. DS2015 TaxID=3373917 RepID=UPI003D1F1A09
MRKYWEMMKSQIKIDTAYSGWYWSSTASMILRMLIIYAFWHAVYENRTTIEGMPLDIMITYVVLAMVLNNYLAGVGTQLGNSVRDGSVAIELMRPYNLLDKLVALDLGDKISGTIREAVPLLIIAYLFMGINTPNHWTDFILFLLSALLGILIGTQLDLAVGIMAFWLTNIWGLRMLRNAIILFFSGGLLPITMFPEWLQMASRFLPFQYMIYVPVSIYTGQISGLDALYALLVQIFWLILVFVIIRLTWSLAIRKVTIFGG